MKALVLDGSEGEGGGQILRSALTLSMITGQPFRLENIRARRAKPGLLRQHLTAVQASAAIADAAVDGATPGSRRLSFIPRGIRGGDYRFAIGTAGSCTLVLQTVLPALWYADSPATVSVSGGTHNPAAPPADFLLRAWLPLVRRLGVRTEIELLRHGFFPAGGGEVCARVEPGAPAPLEVVDRGTLCACRAVAIVAGVPADVARREIAEARLHLPQLTGETRVLPQREGPGNALLIEVEHSRSSEIFTGFGARGVRAERVASQVAAVARDYLESGAAVGEHLADQLVLPLALAGGGRLLARRASNHLLTNLAVIGKFLPVSTRVEAAGGNWLIEVEEAAPLLKC
ncbi:RNA 3'-terminal phosphate cyclase [Accumulibacter sp.]|uniref:RNA 3'-terminal phosphate cyclase n=1 Tax=Accumulibacter sp. TaxID=2053492 RepID=UPI00262E3342|nr:RNA 3'-terminal phosphate cyclase [Accumulibacter sp.]